jgi:SAM-dependent methyltransferase
MVKHRSIWCAEKLTVGRLGPDAVERRAPDRDVERRRQIRAYYDSYHAAKSERAWRPPDGYLEFLNCLGVESGRRLLDVGCGTGHLLAAAAERGLYTCGIDLSEQGVRIARRVSPQSDVVAGSGDALPFATGSFDYVTCIGALEHFLDIPGALGEIRRVAKDGAMCCVVVPNARYLSWLMARRRGTEQRVLEETLLSLGGWRQLIASQNLRVVSIHRDLWPGRIPLSAEGSVKDIARRLALKAFFAAHPIAWTYQFIFVLRKPA